MIDLLSVQTILFDINGTLYRGKRSLPGVAAFLRYLDQRGIRYACLSNNDALTPRQQEHKLTQMGIHIPAARILTSAVVTTHVLRSTYPRATTVYAIGMHGLREALFSDGYFISDDQHPQVVVQGYDTALTYEKLRLGAMAIYRGANFLVTNPDHTIPTEHGFIPHAGALGAILQTTTGVTPTVIGKPAPTMFRAALDMLGGNPNTTLVIGDQLETDIEGAFHAGLRSALVLTGVSTRSQINQFPYRPDAVFSDMHAVLDAFTHMCSA